MNNNLHKRNKGELHMYDFIAIIYRIAIIVFLIMLFFFLTPIN